MPQTNPKKIFLVNLTFKIMNARHSGNYLGIKLSYKVKVLLQIGGQYGLNDQETETLELHMVQVNQEVVLWL